MPLPSIILSQWLIIFHSNPDTRFEVSFAYGTKNKVLSTFGCHKTEDNNICLLTYKHDSSFPGAYSRRVTLHLDPTGIASASCLSLSSASGLAPAWEPFSANWPSFMRLLNACTESTVLQNLINGVQQKLHIKYVNTYHFFGHMLQWTAQISLLVRHPQTLLSSNLGHGQ